ncbi:hypothetical protein BBJ28_00012769 [Nothophytophthora sp. Chile5]|nr:hypothetical protein BBJ28_00012769 [Nothophytophthora sp. Chile5]
MERFFLEHHVQQDRDADEVGGRVNSDSEASDEEEITDRVHSVADPTGPWAQKPVTSGNWGQPTRGLGGAKGRNFASAHTGPKGVINDYKAHKRYQKQEVRFLGCLRQAVLNRIAKGVTVSARPSAQDPTALVDCECNGDSDCECDDCDLVDDAFLAQYAEMRTQQMQGAAKARKVFGEFEYLSPEQFVELTSASSDTQSQNSNILVHLYHPENYACGLLNTQLELLAKKLIHVKVRHGFHGWSCTFWRSRVRNLTVAVAYCCALMLKFAAMVAKDADASIAMADLPVMLVFRGQQQQEAIVDVVRQLDGEFTLERVEAFVREQLGL